MPTPVLPPQLLRLAADAADEDAALGALKAAGVSPIRAIVALYLGRGLTLAEAKQALGRCSAWAPEVQAAEVLHDKIEQALEDDSAPGWCLPGDQQEQT